MKSLVKEVARNVVGAGLSIVSRRQGTKATEKDLDWEVITPQKGNYCFGYYDRCPLTADNQYHLAICFSQQTRIPGPGESAQVGFVECRSKRFINIAATLAWNHQQGSMTQWLPDEPNHFIFNDFREERGTHIPCSRVYDLEGNHIRDLDYPNYVLSHSGRWSAVLDFARIPRRGYSYANAPLPSSDPVPDLDLDGLQIMDMASNELKLIAPYREFIALLDDRLDLNASRIWLNHAAFNTDDSRLLVLFRTSDRKGRTWKTYSYTMNLDGSDMLCPLPHRYWVKWSISHHTWGRTPHEMLIDAKLGGERNSPHEYCVFDEHDDPTQCISISQGLGPKGHPIFSPDGKWIACDTYPDTMNGLQQLCLVEVENGKCTNVGSFYHRWRRDVGVRCDLHPRWSSDSKFLTIDTIHFGERKILMLDVEKATSRLFPNGVRE